MYLKHIFLAPNQPPYPNSMTPTKDSCSEFSSGFTLGEKISGQLEAEVQENHRTIIRNGTENNIKDQYLCLYQRG